MKSNETKGEVGNMERMKKIEVVRGRIMVRAWQSSLDGCIVLDAWMKVRGIRDHNFGTITSRDYMAGTEWYGKIGTRGPVASAIADLPVGEERSRKVRSGYDQDAERAYRIIRSVFGDVRGRESMGEIEVSREAFEAAYGEAAAYHDCGKVERQTFKGANENGEPIEEAADAPKIRIRSNTDISDVNRFLDKIKP